MELFDIDAERAFLGACLLDYKKVSNQKLPSLQPEDFYKTFHQDLYSTIIECAQASSVNVITVTSRMKLDFMEKNYEYGEIFSMQDVCPSISDAEYYAKIIFDHAQKRNLRNTLEALRCGVESGEFKTEEAFDLTIQRVFSLYGRSDGADFKREERAYDILEELETVAQEALIEGKCLSASETLPTGFVDFDNYYGFKRGNIIYVGGRPSMGKTTATLQAALYMAMNDSEDKKLVDKRRLIIYFSMEVPKEDLQKKIACVLERMEYACVDRQIMTQACLDSIKSAKEKLKNCLLFIIDKACSIAEMRMYIKQIQAKTKKNVDAIFIDRMEFITDKQGARENENDYITKKSKALTIMAKEFKAAVICLIQLSREAAKRKNKDGSAGKPVLSDIRGSGSVEQDAKMVVFVHRECMLNNTKDDKAELIIAKHMCGGTGSVPLLFNENIPMFNNIGKPGLTCLPEPKESVARYQQISFIDSMYKDEDSEVSNNGGNGGNGKHVVVSQGGDDDYEFDYKSTEGLYDCELEGEEYVM